MNSEPLDPSVAGEDSTVDEQQYRRLLQFQAMLEDRDWAASYDEAERVRLRAALNRLTRSADASVPELDAHTLDILDLEAEDYADYRAFRDEILAAHSGDEPPDVSLEAWLHDRVKAYELAEAEHERRVEPYADTRPVKEGFRVL